MPVQHVQKGTLVLFCLH